MNKARLLIVAVISVSSLLLDLVALGHPAVATSWQPLYLPGSEEQAESKYQAVITPQWSTNFLPLPLISVYSDVELQHTPGPLDQYAHAAFSWDWFSRDVYDPTRNDRVALASYLGPNNGLSPFFTALLAYGYNFDKRFRLYLQGRYMASNLEPNAGSWLAAPDHRQGIDHHYDPEALVAGPIALLGPRLDIDFADDLDFPTAGWRARAAVDLGPRQLGNRTKSGQPNDFALYRGQIEKFVQIDTDRTLIFNLVGGYGRGNIPVYFRFASGGMTYQRGYLADRFSGDLLLVGSVEWRHAAWQRLLSWGELGLMYHAYLDVGRTWETAYVVRQDQIQPAAIPFLQDIRPGAGMGLGLMMGRKVLGRLDLMIGTEGIPVFPLLGGAILSPLYPGVSLSFQEAW
ncbi:MAG: BamA/TamA family outer membrane protein [Cyanobacteria bacterium NC_groundwater_1444_Ag_S-0.65um_54_12]|nr:BamA/TamA family outer membrane protein [Cyanobacteria bacterium NC_groundwater_1444_Ag_S-0.65um_54_12]